MKRSIFLIVILLIVAATINAQTFVDPDMKVEAKVFAHEMATAPSIDGMETEWGEIPWTVLHYNDKDFNGDGLVDPFPGKIDYQSKFKSAWVAGSNVIYFLINIRDDQFHVADSVNWYNVDGMELRIDPFDNEDPGEPSSDGTAFNLGFKIGKDEANGLEGPETAYEAKWTVNEDVMPKVAQLEVAITLPSSVVLSSNYVMGFHLYCSDNDFGQDSSPTSKDAATVLWPQLYNSNDSGNRLGVDAIWENIYMWGNLECISPTVHNVAAGGSIQSAVDAANYGDIIKLAAGQYSENVVINKPQIRIVGSNGTELSAADANMPIIKIADNDDAYGVVIENISFISGSTGIETGSAQTEILNNYFTGLSAPVVKSTTTGETNAYACVMEDNYVYACEGGLSMNTPNTVFRYNKVEENTSSYGINTKGLPAENIIDVAYNYVFNHKGECAIGYGGSGVFTVHHNMLIRSEQLYGAGDTSGDDGIENQDEGGSTDYIYNNTVVGWKSDGMQFGNGTSKFHVRNNLIAYCAAKDYDIRTVDTTDIDYGLSFSNESDNIATLAGTVGLTSDPLFTDQLEDDYTITDASPAVDAGQILPFGFKVMFAGNGVDIGAFETGLGKITLGVKNITENTIPNNYSLAQNYPNPFNPSTTINFTIPSNSSVELSVYNILGQKVATLVNKELSAGSYEYNFDASQLSSGIYVYSIRANNFNATRKMMLLK